jgi:hypothetical protein
MVGITVVTGTFWFPDRLTVVVVTELVVRATVTLSKVDKDGVVEDED